ncbi:hypothetical protein [uncultured Reyranella sp.]|uniref:hypothetical protein n=1 Tax=uncultured Reyranella sp. TaxID=735512 RepID=UPI00259C8C89|nr:hypothetical protein [uncultured Reyranella sp.]
MTARIHRIEISFAVAVDLPHGVERELVEIAARICRAYEAEHRDSVMWPAGIGSKVTYMPWTAEEEAAGRHMEFDDSVFAIECAERERFDSEPYMPSDSDWQAVTLATVGWGGWSWRRRRRDP